MHSRLLSRIFVAIAVCVLFLALLQGEGADAGSWSYSGKFTSIDNPGNATAGNGTLCNILSLLPLNLRACIFNCRWLLKEFQLNAAGYDRCIKKCLDLFL